MVKLSNYVLLILCLVLISSPVLAIQSNNPYTFNILPPPPNVTIINQSINITGIINNSNTTDFWNTNIGFLGNVNDTQFENNGGFLSLIPSWLNSVINSFGFITQLFANDTYRLKTNHTFLGDVNVTGNINVTNNISVGDNVIILDKLYVGDIPSEIRSVINPGDAGFVGNVISNSSLIAFANKFLFGLSIFKGEDSAAGVSPFFASNNAILNVTTGVFCDGDNDPFEEAHVGRSVVNFFSDVLGTEQAGFEILRFINSTCVDVSLSTIEGEGFGDINISFWVLTPAPIFVVGGGSSVTANLGASRDSNFRINALNSSGSGKLQLNVADRVKNVLGFLIDHDANGFKNPINFASLMRSSKAVDGSVQINSLISGDFNNYTNGEYTAVSLEILGEGTNVSKTGIDISSQFDTIIRIAQEEEIGRAYYDDASTTVDITSDLNDPLTATTLFQNDSSIVYIGNSVNFTTIAFSVLSDGTQSINPVFSYCNSSEIYQEFDPLDDTSGFMHSGNIQFINPTNRGTCNTEIDGTPLANTTKMTYIAVQRNQSILAVEPILRTAILFTKSSEIIFGNPPGVVGANRSFAILNELDLPEGEPSFLVTSKDAAGQRRVNFWLIARQNESGGGTYNSFGLFPDNDLVDQDKLNLTMITNLRQRWDNYGIGSLLDYDSAENRTSLASLFAVESQKLVLHDGLGNGQLFGEGNFRWISDGSDIDLHEGDVSIKDEVVKVFGLPAGFNFTIFSETFEGGSLGSFTLITSGKGFDEWDAQIDVGDCPDTNGGTICTRAGPLGGSGDTIMQANYSTLNIKNQTLNFSVNTIDMSSGGDLEITFNNNVGSGDVSIFSLVGSDVFDAIEQNSLPVSMDNQTTITINFIFSSSHPNRGESFVDDIAINGSTIISSQQNVTVEDGTIEFGDGSCKIEMSEEQDFNDLNISCDRINLIGNVTSVSITEVTLNVTENVTIQNTLFVDFIDSFSGNGITFLDNITGLNATFDNFFGNIDASFIQNAPWVTANFHDQDLNTTDNVTFHSVEIKDNLSVGFINMTEVFAAPAGAPNKIDLFNDVYGFGVSAGFLDLFSDNGFNFWNGLILLASMDGAGNFNVSGNISTPGNITAANIGIGTTTLTAELDVNGSVNVEQNITIGDSMKDASSGSRMYWEGGVLIVEG